MSIVLTNVGWREDALMRAWFSAELLAASVSAGRSIFVKVTYARKVSVRVL